MKHSIGLSCQQACTRLGPLQAEVCIKAGALVAGSAPSATGFEVPGDGGAVGACVCSSTNNAMSTRGSP